MGSLQEGNAVIEGRVVSGKTLSIPGSQSRPVYFEMTTEKYGTGPRGRGRAMWMPSTSDRRITPFALEDDTGRIWIAAEDSSSDVSGGTREQGEGKTGRSRYVAHLIAPGDHVRVRGTVTSARKGEPERLVMRAPQGGALEILFRKRRS